MTTALATTELAKQINAEHRACEVWMVEEQRRIVLRELTKLAKMCRQTPGLYPNLVDSARKYLYQLGKELREIPLRVIDVSSEPK